MPYTSSIIIILLSLVFVVTGITIIVNYVANKKYNFNLIALLLICPIVVCITIFDSKVSEYTNKKITELVPTSFEYYAYYDSDGIDEHRYRDNNGNSATTIKPFSLYVNEGYTFTVKFIEHFTTDYQIEAFGEYGTYDIKQCRNTFTAKLTDDKAKTGDINILAIVKNNDQLNFIASKTNATTLEVTCYSSKSINKLNNEYQPSYFVEKYQITKKDAYDFKDCQTVLKVKVGTDIYYMVD